MPDPALGVHDRRLLQAIATLSERAGGRPPTVAEIAVELGFAPSSKAGIQRHLVELRPQYVTWGPGARSLRLTAAALAVLDTPLPVASEEPLQDDILRLLASGLTWLASEQTEGRVPRVPYRDVWQRALNRLLCGSLEHGIRDMPMDAVAVAQLCQRPLATWPVRFRLADRFPTERLLTEDGEPTPLCRELALERSDAELELEEQLILPVLDLCRLHRAPQTYVAFRSYLIEHPVVDLATLMTASFDPQLGDVGAQLVAMYEPLPTLLQEPDGSVLRCPICGWTLARGPRGTLQCGDNRCRVLSDGFARPNRMPHQPALHRVRRAIRRYILAPGRYEVDTANRLREIGESAGLRVDLWPSYDAYDLRITFADGDVWAVDLKDWRFPTLLARTLTPLSRAGDLAWTVAFYVIPDARLSERPDYLALLAAATPQRDFELCTINDLVGRVRDRLAQRATTTTPTRAAGRAREAPAAPEELATLAEEGAARHAR